MKKSVVCSGLGLVLIGLGAVAASAQDAPRMRQRSGPEKQQRAMFGPRAGHGPFGERMIRALGLTDAQVEAWREGETARRDEMRPLIEELRELRGATDTLLEGAEPDPATVGQLVISAHGVETEIAKVRRAHEEAFVSILDEEQRIRLDALKEARRDRDGRPHDGLPRMRQPLAR